MMNKMKTRNLPIDYLPFRNYPNGIFKLHLAIILSIIIITRFFVLMVIPKYNRKQSGINTGTHFKIRISHEEISFSQRKATHLRKRK